MASALDLRLLISPNQIVKYAEEKAVSLGGSFLVSLLAHILGSSGFTFWDLEDRQLSLLITRERSVSSSRS